MLTKRMKLRKSLLYYILLSLTSILIMLAGHSLTVYASEETITVRVEGEFDEDSPYVILETINRIRKKSADNNPISIYQEVEWSRSLEEQAIQLAVAKRISGFSKAPDGQEYPHNTILKPRLNAYLRRH